MPKYRVQSGELDHVVETHYPATPQAIAVMALSSEPRCKKLGLLTEISGGEYKGESTIYVSTVKVLEDMGMLGPFNY